MRTYVNALGCGQWNSKRFGAAGKWKKKQNKQPPPKQWLGPPGAYICLFCSKIINTGLNYPSSEKNFVLAAVTDPRLADANRTGSSAPLSSISGTLLTNWADRKLWHQHIWGGGEWSKWGIRLWALSLRFINVLSRLRHWCGTKDCVCVPCQELTLTLHI